MKKTRKQADPLEEMLRQATKQQQDDIVRHTVRFNDVETTVVEKKRKIEWKADPQNNGILVPYLVSDVIYSLDEDGQPFKKMNNVGACKYGCIVRTSSLLSCRKCRSTVCKRHSLIITGERAYCRKGSCLVIGVINKILWVLYRLISFCIRSILGLRGNDESST